ncbi:transcriptional regulator, ArsR family [Pseudorhodobacter antarcticus]|jgi:ArsR family transcriptional regulator|uniref:Transcriptional regulator, ArsR family n=1 Tax=Pseudorhodobacter antarcticus TaxID=1077947 RepID=A0A1H8BWY4_9RHOB|nr:metalloregulator ArsR/SmtB family transcription factor [Pseudorhodobacter antarcticus]SEM86518.1 transcriptional regulator, ArsR family [Pseudorhodobacter antarcticus]
MSFAALRRPARDATPAIDCASVPAEDLVKQAENASNFLKALSHEGRLMILCHLTSGEKSVTELETLLGSRQAAVSQQLARLRLEGLVSCRRDGKAIYYALSDPRAQRMMGLIHEMFCGDLPNTQ